MCCNIPILKTRKSRPSQPSSYPVALVSCVVKLMKRMIVFHIVGFLEKRQSVSTHPVRLSPRLHLNRPCRSPSIVHWTTNTKTRISATMFFDIKGAFCFITHASLFTALDTLPQATWYSYIGQHRCTIVLRTRYNPTITSNRLPLILLYIPHFIVEVIIDWSNSPAT